MAPVRPVHARGGAVVARHHADVLELQRTAGNRAVTAMLRDSGRSSVHGRALQRVISTRPSDMRSALDQTGGARRTLVRGRYDKLIEALRYYHAATKPEEKLQLTQLIQMRARIWLEKHGSRKTKGEDYQASRVTQLLADAKGEEQALRAQAAGGKKREQAYLDDIKSGSMTAMNPLSGGYHADTGKKLASGQQAGGGPGADQAAVDFVAKYQLTAAEATAIRTFTAGDYAYINPAMAGDDKWLGGNLANAKDPHLKSVLADPMRILLLKAEGARHAAMIMQALAKLPAYTKLSYRGERRAGQEFLKRYSKGAVLPANAAFASASKNRDVAEKFARGEGGDTSVPAEKTVSVLMFVSPTNARDVTAISAKGKEEAEVMLLPGAQLQVTDVKRKRKGEPGKPPATNWYEVYLKQVK